MALIKCPECKKEVSDKAITCPNCGFELQVGKIFCPNCKSLNVKKTSLMGRMYTSHPKLYKCEDCKQRW